MEEPHELTAEEARDRFLDILWDNVDYWDQERRATTAREKLAGLAFSILTLIDGCAADTPAFRLIVQRSPEDAEYYQEQGEDWWPEVELRDLHDHWHERERARDAG